MRVSKPAHQRRAELVAAARRLFDEKGVARTRVSDIVAQVGVAQGVFYYYFVSKDEMVQEVLREVGEETFAAANTILADKNADFGGKLSRFIELYIDLVDQFLGDDETDLSSLLEDGQGRGDLTAQSAHQLTQCLETLVRQGVASGELTAAHPWETAQVLLYGFLKLAERQLPTRAMLYDTVERAMGLQRGTLARGGAKHSSKGGPAK